MEIGLATLLDYLRLRLGVSKDRLDIHGQLLRPIILVDLSLEVTKNLHVMKALPCQVATLHIVEGQAPSKAANGFKSDHIVRVTLAALQVLQTRLSQRALRVHGMPACRFEV